MVLMIALWAAAPIVGQFDITAAQGAQLTDRQRRDVLIRFSERLEELARSGPAPPGREDPIGPLVERGAALFPDEPRMRFWLGELHRRSGRTEEAISAWHRALETPSRLEGPAAAPVQALCHCRLGAQHLSTGNGAKAAEHARSAITLAPALAAGYELLIETSLLTGDIDRVAETLKLAANRHGHTTPLLPLLYLDFLAQTGDWATLRARLARLEANAACFEEVQHFRGRLAEVEGNERAAFVHHFVAMQAGAEDRPTTARSRDHVSRQLQAIDAAGAGPRGALLRAWLWHDRGATSAQAQALLDAFEPAGPEEWLVVQHLFARAATVRGEHDRALELWRSVIARFPEYAPAHCFLGELYEAAGDFAQADAHFERARQLRPTNWKVRQVDYTGARFALVADGLRVRTLRSKSTWDRLGIGRDWVLLQIDDEVLAELPAVERISAASTCETGELVFRTPDGSVVRREIGLLPR